MQESPRGGSVNSSVSSSSPVRRDAPSISPQQTTPINMPHFCASGAAPMAGHQLLIDPATGQHYLVSSGPPQHHAQIFYQPVYYSPTPAQPVYYQPFATGAQGAYIMAQPITSTQGGAVPIMPPHAIGQRFSGTPPSATVPASLPGGYAQSVADSEDLRSLPVGEDHQSFLQHRLNAQNEALRAPEAKIQKLISSKKSQSPPSSPPFAVSHSGVLMQPFASIAVHKPPTTRQDGSCQTGNSSPSHTEPRPEHLGISSQRTPLFGAAPSWWGEDEKGSREEDERAHTDAETSSRRNASSSPLGPKGDTQAATVSDTEVITSVRIKQLREQSPPAGMNVRRTFKPVRMDIDFNKPFEEEETVKKEEKTKAVIRAPPTAFTVSFDNNENGKANLSLQDAAKKSSTRRLLRRSAPSSAATFAAMAAAGLPEAADPKKYLLNKMLMGSGPATGFSGASDLLTATSEGDDKKEIDALSEAGTYVVDEKDRQLDQMVASQQNDSDDDSDSESLIGIITEEQSEREKREALARRVEKLAYIDDSTATRSTERTPSPSSTADISQISARLTDTPRSSGEGGEKNDALLRQLMRLGTGRQGKQSIELQKNVVAPSTPPLTTTVANVRPCQAAAQRQSGANVTTAASRGGVRRGTSGTMGTTTSTTSARLASVTSVSNAASPRVTPSTVAASVRVPHHSAHAHCLTPSASANTSAATSTAGTNFRWGTIQCNDLVSRRGDGGRFSMRTASSGGASSRGQPSNRNVVARPPFRVGGNTRISTTFDCLCQGYGSSGGQKESAEMTAWLRRKDYNPMKAAAEARKLQQFKARTDHFTSNRSISFHQGSRAEPSTALQGREMGKSRCNRSHDDLASEDGCGPETILASYSKGITRDLNRLKLAEGSSAKKPQVSELEKAVQQLALKCNRSIELIRNAHQGHLSESVESLLERAVQPTNARDTSVADQLDRLSAAFDAIQKYLEVQLDFLLIHFVSSTPTSAPSSPSAGSVSPVRCCPSSNSSSPSHQRGTFRSRLVTPKRSPSGGRTTTKS
ncbi:unnamed protein product [Toxocara canis]|uniref:MIF4G domain-containing protein n=1 Tax=Toxocara canis TaxID=6265 RepID=A0A183UF55_TOXCA|nr:unnamed protein product [Toxocara canis]